MISSNIVKMAEMDGSNITHAFKIINELQLPVLENYCSKEGVATLTFLKKDIFGNNNKRVMKYISVFERCYDITSFERFIQNKSYRNWIINSSKDDVIRIISIIADNNISMHTFQETLPAISDKKPPEYFTKLNEFIIRIFKYSDYTKFLPFANYQRILNAPNQDIMNEGYNFITNAINLKEIKKGGTNSEININNDKSYMKINKLPSTTCVSFSKDAKIISSIGLKTRCCFKRGGFAEALVYAAILSPIAGIIHGSFGKFTWFSFIWEAMEVHVKDNHVEFNKVLILDNVEAYPSPYITENNFNYIISHIKSLRAYKDIRLGSNYNDITNFSQLFKKYKITNRDKVLRGFESNFKSYGSDSEKLYNISSRKYHDDDTQCKIADIGDLYRLSYWFDDNISKKTIIPYINKVIKFKQSKEEDLNLFVEFPSFLIESSTSILGFIFNIYNVKDNSLEVQSTVFSDKLTDIVEFKDLVISNLAKCITEHPLTSIKYTSSKYIFTDEKLLTNEEKNLSNDFTSIYHRFSNDNHISFKVTCNNYPVLRKEEDKKND